MSESQLVACAPCGILVAFYGPSEAQLGPVLGLIARTGQGPILGPIARVGEGTYIRAGGQGWPGTCTRAEGQQHRPSSTFSSAIRRPPTFSSAPPTPPAPTLPAHALSVLSCMQAHLKLEHIPPALRTDANHRTLLCAHAQTSKRGGWPI